MCSKKRSIKYFVHVSNIRPMVRGYTDDEAIMIKFCFVDRLNKLRTMFSHRRSYFMLCQSHIVFDLCKICRARGPNIVVLCVQVFTVTINISYSRGVIVVKSSRPGVSNPRPAVDFDAAFTQI